MAIKSLSQYKNTIFDIDFLKPFEGIPSHSLFSEFIAVFYGIKPVLRTYAIRPDKYPLLKKICKKFSLFTEYSDFRISSKDDTIISPFGPFVYVYISKSKQLSKEAKKTEEDIFLKRQFFYEKSLRFSQLMGYPKCCFDFFRNYMKNNSHRSDLIEHNIYKNTDGKFSFYLNNLIRGDYYLVSHYPCSYNCELSVIYAKKVLKSIKIVNPEIAGKTLILLKSPVIKFIRRGYFMRFTGAGAQNNEIVYKNCEGDEGLVKKFIKGNRLEVGKKKIKIFKDDLLVDVYDKKNELDGVIFDFK